MLYIILYWGQLHRLGWENMKLDIIRVLILGLIYTAFMPITIASSEISTAVSYESPIIDVILSVENYSPIKEAIEKEVFGAVEGDDRIMDEPAFYDTEVSDESENIFDKILSPIGWAIGGVVAPVYLGVDIAGMSVGWTIDNVIRPVGSGIDLAFQYTTTPVVETFCWGWDHIVVPATDWLFELVLDKAVYYALKSTFWITDKTLDYTVFWVIDKTFIYVLVPVGKGVYYGTDIGMDYVVIPFTKGVYKGAKFVAAPITKNLIVGAKYTVVPVGKGLIWGAKTIESGMDYSSRHFLKPIGEGIWYGIDRTLTPIGNAIDAAVNTIMSIPIINLNHQTE